ncbi:TonB-dependent receptor [Yeosuana marina]|uniref:TonB-dependent receptor n=1 Tax=Yeosuana marina TaxID=1565536 RepID=UPI0030EC1C83|tara:strand:+ start:3151 stop:4872 length:1722 start_codon:yes stop_codon:yes gene_type:complete
MRKHANTLILAIFGFTATVVFSQEKDTINTGVINVVKPYTPTISDAFKVKETPSIDDEETATKKDIKYNIFSFPVASTFTPAKGKAAMVEKSKPVKLYDNYATLGVGTYTTILGEVYLNNAISRTESVSGYISHHSSQGGIEDLLLDDKFSNSKINVNYSNRLRDLTWNVDAGFQHQMYNWYGLPQSMVTVASANDIDGKHSFFGAHLGSDVTFENTYINSGSFLFRRFGDNQGSGENRFVIKSTIDLPINREEISTDIVFDYLGGAFDRSYETTDELKYGNFQIGVTPKYQLKQDDLTVNLGASVFYLNDIEANDSKVYIYPNVTASYRLVNDILIAYGGVKGGLIQNSYYDFATENPFVSPTLFIQPTDQLYNAYVGLKGKVSSNMSYNISGRYISDRNKALFINNNITATSQDYSYGNSFGIVYDNVDAFSLAGEINVDVNRNFKLGIKAEYFSYTSDMQAEAWNLPDIKGSLFLDYQINEHWFTGANVFYVGERKDQFYLNDPFIATTPFTVILDSYFDANLHLGYHVNDQLSVFAKANNLADDGYQRWQNFPVQGIQFLAGATYKFDF